jgi:outer membrane lipoprotein-sorting protein
MFFCVGVVPSAQAEDAADVNALSEAEASERLDAWLLHQAEIQSWTADVVQIRELRSLVKPLETAGQVWFARPDRFRWQLGDPPRTVAIRSGEELVISYPRLRQLERYALGGELDPMWRYVLDLLEVGFPSDAASFHGRYDLSIAQAIPEGWRFRLQPSAEQARRLLEAVQIEVAREDLRLLATELIFPDGSRMKNRFSNHRIDPELAPALFEVEVGEDWQESSPLAK